MLVRCIVMVLQFKLIVFYIRICLIMFAASDLLSCSTKVQWHINLIKIQVRLQIPLETNQHILIIESRK
jgi:hypothetical protein